MSFASLYAALYPRPGFTWARRPDHPENEDQSPSAQHQRAVASVIEAGQRIEMAPMQAVEQWSALREKAAQLLMVHEQLVHDPVQCQLWSEFLQGAYDVAAHHAAA